MLSYDERALLHWAARVGAPKSGAIVDAGCFLGGSTLSLGHGLLRRQTDSVSQPGGGVTVHSFDLFRVGEERERTYFDETFPFEVGASTLELYRANIAGVRDRVTVHAGDINDVDPWNQDISLLFIDIAKSWQTNDTILRRFFPHLTPGAIVVQQDLVHFGHPWCAITMELLADKFEYLGFVSFSSAVYALRSPIAPSELPADIVGRLSAERVVSLIERCAARIGDPQSGYLRLAAATALVYYGRFGEAREVIARVSHDPASVALPWISDHIATVTAFVDVAQTDSHAHKDPPR
jgi:Methyltransferase domain